MSEKYGITLWDRRLGAVHTCTMLGLCRLCGDGTGRCGLLMSPAELRSLH